ncbi:MAG: NADH dehydrogenase [Thermobacillus sp. ZCTH02-B1]|uniref:NAD(P)/FAD-dependent oxidoreductase n=1 Tax=Thermobacillus sp. ZCTH02-B1 TaxID=1858795 RepID=UPI000B552364|nr:NAD(P)/FAD-dependent oxidoreductase [Thermobacillus sp. ZCTH02-B1]OUM95649.1 MAG: NADH dehydrogenase [Thermobacillus sp. ZCTH02-B1]
MAGTKKIVVLGGGYAGISAVLALQKRLGRGEAEIILVNKHDYHYFTTWLHKPAAGTDSADRPKVDIRDIIDPRKVSFRKRDIRRIDTAARTVETDEGDIPYDVLIVALGGEPETFGIPGLAEHAFFIRSLNSARIIREHIERRFAEFRSDESRTELLTFVVGGAGLTGIEFAGELVNRIPELCREHGVDPALVNIYVVEAAPTALPGFDAGLVEHAMEHLKRKGVVFQLGTPVKKCTSEGVEIGEGEFIRAGTVIWAGGIRGNRVLEASGFGTTRGRVAVNAYLQAPGFGDVFVIGDSSMVMNDQGRPWPPSAQIAIQQGEAAARNAIALLRGREMTPFRYVHRGTVASLGRGEAIGSVGRCKVKGLAAAILKTVIDARYLYRIGGVRLVLRKTAFFPHQSR